MKAAQLVAHGAPGQFRIWDVPDPEPGPDEVVVEVKACGLNHLDLWMEQAGLPIGLQLPRIPGCEVAGTIASLGWDVDEWRVRDRVAVQSNLFCGVCEYCLRGDESLCLKGQLLGVQRDGGFAEKVAVPARSLVSLPENLPFETSAALTLAGSTAMHMLTTRAEVNRGDWVLVMAGASGVGSAAIQIANVLGAHVISTGSTSEKRNLAKELGAEFVLDSTQPEWPAEVRQITQKRGVDLVIEHVGGETLVRCFDCLARGGTIVTCGATTSEEVPLHLWSFFVKEQKLVGSYGRNRADLKMTLDWAATGKIKPVIDRIYPLGETPAAFERLRNRQALGKLLIRP